MFEFDSAKSAANQAKHGIDFEQAQALWDDEHLVMIPSSYESEARFLAFGMIEDRLWSAILTRRGENIRLISVRRARKEETDVYEENKRRGTGPQV